MDPLPTSLAGLLAARKGRLAHTAGDAFVLYVFWEAPSAAAARRLLAGLAQCAAATQRDTPCVPTYVFRTVRADAELCPPPPRTVGDHPQIREAKKKLDVGIPPAAVRAELAKRGIDPALVDQANDALLPETLQMTPVKVEFTELYLDERSFMEHAGSRDYLDGYAVVMNPALHYRTPTTVRVGTPPPGMVDRILEPVLHERVEPVQPGCAVWRRPAAGLPDASRAVLLALDVDRTDAATLAAALPPAFREHCTTCLVFAHPLRDGTARLVAVLPSPDALAGLAALMPARGEAHCAEEPADVAATLRAALDAAGLGLATVNGTERVGYILHPRALDVHVQGDGDAFAAPSVPPQAPTTH